MVRRVGVLGSALASVVVLAACATSGPKASDPGPARPPAGSGASSASLRVVASTDVYADIVSQIAGNRAEVTSIISNPDADPHSYQASTRNQLAVSKADIVIENGGGYDDFLSKMINSSGNTAATVLNVVKISGKKAPADGELNEHVWYDFPTVKKLANKLVSALSARDPADAATFKANGQAFTTKLEQLEAAEASIKHDHAGEAVAITEPVPVYMLASCGLQNKAPDALSEAVEEGTAVPALVLKNTLRLFSQHSVKLLVYNEQTSGPITQKVIDAATANHIPAVPVTETLPDGQDYLNWMQSNLAAIRAALGPAE